METLSVLARFFVLLRAISLHDLKDLAVGLFVFVSTSVVLGSIVINEIYKARIKLERNKQKLLRERAKTLRLQFSTVDAQEAAERTSVTNHTRRQRGASSPNRRNSNAPGIRSTESDAPPPSVGAKLRTEPRRRNRQSPVPVPASKRLLHEASAQNVPVTDGQPA